MRAGSIPTFNLRNPPAIVGDDPLAVEVGLLIDDAKASHGRFPPDQSLGERPEIKNDELMRLDEQEQLGGALKPLPFASTHALHAPGVPIRIVELTASDPPPGSPAVADPDP